MTNIGDAISRLRNLLKVVKEDAFLTDRFLYSLIMKHGRTLIRRQDNENKILRQSNLFEKIPCMELEEIDKVDSCCGITSGCIIKRTKDLLPEVIDGVNGPLIRNVSSIDSSITFIRTTPVIYNEMIKSTSFKYNTNKYYWFLNKKLYFPNVDWEAVSVEALFAENIGHLQCATEDSCVPMQDRQLSIPDYLFTEIDMLILKDLGVMMQLPQEQQDNGQNILRS